MKSLELFNVLFVCFSAYVNLHSNDRWKEKSCLHGFAWSAQQESSRVELLVDNILVYFALG